MTSAVKLNRRPPLTTFETRLMVTNGTGFSPPSNAISATDGRRGDHGRRAYLLIVATATVALVVTAARSGCRCRRSRPGSRVFFDLRSFRSAWPTFIRISVRLQGVGQRRWSP